MASTTTSTDYDPWPTRSILFVSFIFSFWINLLLCGWVILFWRSHCKSVSIEYRKHRSYAILSQNKKNIDCLSSTNRIKYVVQATDNVVIRCSAARLDAAFYPCAHTVISINIFSIKTQSIREQSRIYKTNVNGFLLLSTLQIIRILLTPIFFFLK